MQVPTALLMPAGTLAHRPTVIAQETCDPGARRFPPQSRWPQHQDESPVVRFGCRSPCASIRFGAPSACCGDSPTGGEAWSATLHSLTLGRIRSGLRVLSSTAVRRRSSCQFIVESSVDQPDSRAVVGLAASRRANSPGGSSASHLAVGPGDHSCESMVCMCIFN